MLVALVDTHDRLGHRERDLAARSRRHDRDRVDAGIVGDDLQGIGKYLWLGEDARGQVNGIIQRRKRRHDGLERGERLRRQRRKRHAPFAACIGDENAGAARERHDGDPVAARQASRFERLRVVAEIGHVRDFDHARLTERRAI